MEPNSPSSDQPFLKAMRQRRAELREAMSTLDDALAAPGVAGHVRWVQRVQVALVELSGDFRAHVEVTEGPDGLYRDLLRTSPRLSDAVAVLTREHALITDQVEELLSRVASPDAIDDVDGIRDRGTALLGRLVRHRQRGSDLVFEAYEVDIGGET